MNKFGKFILWAALVFVLVAVGILVLAFAKSLTATPTHSMIDSSLTIGYAGVSSENYGGAATGLGMTGSGVVSAVRSLAKNANMEMAAPEIAPQADSVGSAKNNTERMIVKTGDLSVVVKDVRDSIQAVAQFATTQGGFVVNSNVYKIGLVPRGAIVIRIPAKKFDQGINEVKTLGEVVGEQSNGQDVTEEYVDLEAQLRNLRATETQFLAIMVKAQKIVDILNVQRELTAVRGDIERLQGRMKYLKQKADLSTITVNFSTDPAVLPTYDNTPQWKPWAEVKAAARALLEFGKRLVNVAIWLVIFVPIWAIVAVVVWVVVKIIQRIKQKIERND